MNRKLKSSLRSARKCGRGTAGGEHHSCIFASAVLSEVFRRRGFPRACALKVWVKILNPALIAWSEEHGFPSTREEVRRSDKARGSTIWLGILPPGRSMPNGAWVGHIAVVVPNAFGDRHALCDITITQINKPDWGIELPLLVIRVPEDFVKGERGFSVDVNGCRLNYMALPNDQEFKNFSAWKEQARWSSLVDRIVIREAERFASTSARSTFRE